MRFSTSLIAVLLLTFLFNATVTFGQENTTPLKNEDIVKMVKEGLSDPVIVQTIQRYTAAYDVSPTALIDMKRLGCSNVVLEAMSKAMADKTTNPTTNDPKKESEKKERKTDTRKDFIFELTMCQSSGGDSLTCRFSITNNGPERRITIHLSNSYLLEDLTGQFSATDVGIGNSRRVYKFETDVTNTIAEKASVGAFLKFENFKTQSKLIKLLRIHCTSSTDVFDINLRDIQLNTRYEGVSGYVTSGPNTTGEVEIRSPENEVVTGPGAKVLAGQSSDSPQTGWTPIQIDGSKSSGRLPISVTGIKASYTIKYRRRALVETDITKKEDLCSGRLEIGEDALNLKLDGQEKSFHGKDCPSAFYFVPREKFLELKDSSREKWYGNYTYSDYVYLRFTIPVGKGKEDVKEFMIYPPEATVVLGTTRYNIWANKVLTCTNCPAIVCKTCGNTLTEMKRNLLKLAVTSRLKIGNDKIRSGKSS